MALYLLSYDVSQKDHDYQSLWDWLKSLGAIRILYSEWAVPWENNSSATEVTKVALRHVMSGDGILVCELYENAYSIAWRGLRITDDAFRALLRKYARNGG
jgi:hypothetical protein